MNAEQKIKAEVTLMKAWCQDNYSNGADTMVECWGDAEYEEMLQGRTTRAAWQLLKRIVSVYRERQADAAHYSENW